MQDVRAGVFRHVGATLPAIEGAPRETDTGRLMELGSWLAALTPFSDPVLAMEARVALWEQFTAADVALAEQFDFDTASDAFDRLWPMESSGAVQASPFNRWFAHMASAAGIQQFTSAAGTDGRPAVGSQQAREPVGTVGTAASASERHAPTDHGVGLDADAFATIFDTYWTPYFPREHFLPAATSDPDAPERRADPVLSGRPITDCPAMDGMASGRRTRRVTRDIEGYTDGVAARFEELDRAVGAYRTARPGTDRQRLRQDLLVTLGRINHSVLAFYRHSNFIAFVQFLDLCERFKASHPSARGLPSERLFASPEFWQWARGIEQRSGPSGMRRLRTLYRSLVPAGWRTDGRGSTVLPLPSPHLSVGTHDGGPRLARLAAALRAFEPSYRAHLRDVLRGDEEESVFDYLFIETARTRLAEEPALVTNLLETHARRQADGTYSRAVADAVAAGRFRSTAGEALQSALRLDAGFASEYDGRSGPPLYGIVGLFLEVVAFGQREWSAADQESARLDTAEIVVDFRPHNGASREDIGSLALMAELTNGLPDGEAGFGDETAAVAAYAIRRLSSSVIASLNTDAPRATDWGGELRRFIAHPLDLAECHPRPWYTDAAALGESGRDATYSLVADATAAGQASGIGPLAQGGPPAGTRDVRVPGSTGDRTPIAVDSQLVADQHEAEANSDDTPTKGRQRTQKEPCDRNRKLKSYFAAGNFPLTSTGGELNYDTGERLVARLYFGCGEPGGSGDEWAPSGSQREAVTKLVTALRNFSFVSRSLRWRLVGHADPRGSTRYNRALAQRRAEGVATSLTAGFGSPLREPVIESYGEKYSRMDERETWDAARRVDVFVEYLGPKRAKKPRAKPTPPPGKPVLLKQVQTRIDGVYADWQKAVEAESFFNTASHAKRRVLVDEVRKLRGAYGYGRLLEEIYSRGHRRPGSEGKTPRETTALRCASEVFDTGSVGLNKLATCIEDFWKALPSKGTSAGYTTHIPVEIVRDQKLVRENPYYRAVALTVDEGKNTDGAFWPPAFAELDDELQQALKGEGLGPADGYLTGKEHYDSVQEYVSVLRTAYAEFDKLLPSDLSEDLEKSKDFSSFDDL